VRLVASAEAKEPLADANAAFGRAFEEIARNPDFRATAWILGERDGEAPGGEAAITAYRETTNGVTFDADVAGGSPGAWIVLSLVQDGGWSAKDDAGRGLPLLRANGPFLALRLPPGKTRVRLSYSPPGFRAGAWISATVLVALVALAAAAVRRRRKRRPA
jgi:Bacterial membrane protein YfhO